MVISLESASGLPDECILTFQIGHRQRSQYLPGGEADLSFDGALGALCAAGLAVKVAPRQSGQPGSPLAAPVARTSVSLGPLMLRDSATFDEGLAAYDDETS